MSRRLHIVHTNDLHSHFDNMKKISTYIKKVRQELKTSDESLVVADVGDHMDRMHLETEGTNGAANVEVLNKIGTNVITLGNNEGLTFTKETLKDIYEKKQFKILACNLRDITTNEIPEWISEYWIQEIAGIKIGWIGATAPYEIFYRLQGWNVSEPYSKIESIVRKIRQKVDVIILISHLGIRADERIAETISNIDVILGGHTHRHFETGIKKDGQPLVCQVGIFGDYVGHLTIEYDFNQANQVKISTIKEQTIPVFELEDDQEIKDVINKNRGIAENELNKTVAVLDRDIPNFTKSEAPLANLLADGVRSWVNAEIGFINNGQFLEGLRKGIVSKQRLHQICPSPINVCRVRLTGKQIKTTLEQSLLSEFQDMNVKGYGFRGKELGTLAISGIKIIYELNRPPYQKIIRVFVNGQLLEEEKEYLVGTLDMFTFGGGYNLVREGKEIEYFLPEFIRDILAKQLLNIEYIKKSFEKRWFIEKGEI